MISWHKVGQKVACLKGDWMKADRTVSSGPAVGEIGTIAGVEMSSFGPCLMLEEWPHREWGTYLAKHFRPIFPQIIDQLRKLDAPSPELERVKEWERV